MKASLSSPQRKNGAVIAYDFNYKEQARREFFDAIITEIGLPRLDGASKDAVAFILKFRPKKMRGSGLIGASGKPSQGTKQDLHGASLDCHIAGLDAVASGS